MIVPMQKITLLVSGKHTNSALSVLRKLGVVHIEHIRRPQAEHITSLENELIALDKALSIIVTGNIQKNNLDREMLSPYIKEIIELDRERETLNDKLQELEKQSIWFSRWGNVSEAPLAELKEAGVFIRLYIISRKSLRRIPKDKLIYVLEGKAAEVYLAYIGTSEEDRLDFTEVVVPHEDLHSVERKISTTSSKLKHINERLAEISCYRKHFLDYRIELLKRLEFRRVRFGMAEDEGICYLEGFSPKEAVAKIGQAAEREGWAMVNRAPDNPEEVPTLIRNPKWVEIIRPVFRLMGTLPGYGEYDISFWFLVFFSIFFAMLIGDAGYGLIFLVATFFLRKRFKNLPQGPFFLMYLLSLSTIIWGAATGTWFGFEKILHLPLINSLVVNRINSFVATNQLFMIYLCFLIGAIHLSIAHGIAAFRFINSLISLAQLGWICIIWTAFFVAGYLVLNRPLPDFILPLGLSGVASVVLFANPRKNIFKGIALSLADLPLKTISSFSDVVSYLRLFAVGYASVTVATTFNNMALGAGINNVLAALVAALILFLGHSLNIALGLMAVIVHGIRLNMLEFSGHLNMQWSGKEYRPFKE